MSAPASTTASASSNTTMTTPPPPVGPSVVDMPLPRGQKQVSLSAFSYLFAELVSYSQSKITSIAAMEQRLQQAGYGIGLRLVELLSHRERQCRKETSLVAMLQFIQSTVWTSLFGRAADGLEKSTASDAEYYLYDAAPVTNTYISVPKDMGEFNCANFVAGIINGVLDAAEFTCAVAAHFNKGRTVYICTFEPHVIDRDRIVAANS